VNNKFPVVEKSASKAYKCRSMIPMLLAISSSPPARQRDPLGGGVRDVGRGAISPARLPTFTSWLVPGKWVLFGVFSCYRMSLRTCANH
jgi:hypothetical protein